MSIFPDRQEIRALRVCRDCSLEAHTEEDLELFEKYKGSRYGRDTICKKCNRARVKENRCRTAEFVEIFRARNPDGLIKCYFCGEEVTKLKGRDSESLTIHSLDENHKNWSPDNKVPTHHGCHNRHHLTGEKSSRWKGDAASDNAKYKREYRRRKMLNPVLDYFLAEAEG